MANVSNGNTFYCDTTSTANTNIFSSESGVQVLGIIFTSPTAGATFTICDLSQKNDEGDKKISGAITATNETLFLRFADMPVTFSKGIFVKTLSSGTLSIIINKK